MTPERAKKLLTVLHKRQKDITVVLENVFDPHNISAVMRSCDAIGIGEIYVVTTRTGRHKKWGDRSSASANKWVKVHQYEDLGECISIVKKRYGRILSTHLGENAVSLYELKLAESVALVFGNEHDGISQECLDLSDGNFIIPQAGMIQSLNISVACAVSLYEASRQRLLAGKYDQPQLEESVIKEQAAEWGLYLDRTQGYA